MTAQALPDQHAPERCTPDQTAPQLQTVTLFTDAPLLLDCGRPLSGVRVAYHAYGQNPAPTPCW